MSVVAVLAPDRLQVRSGDQAVTELRVRNTGNVVDWFTVEVLGDPAGWTTVTPAILKLFPGKEDKVEIRFAPPLDGSPAAGEHRFGVRVASRDDPRGTTVEEGTVELAPFVTIGATLAPLTARGSGGARFRLTIENSGNSLARTTITVTPRDDEVVVHPMRHTVEVEPGRPTRVQVTVKPLDAATYGSPRAHQIGFSVLAPGADPVSLEGQYLQTSLLPGWVIPGLVGTVVVGAALLALRQNESADPRIAGGREAATSVAPTAEVPASASLPASAPTTSVSAAAPPSVTLPPTVPPPPETATPPSPSTSPSASPSASAPVGLIARQGVRLPVGLSLNLDPGLDPTASASPNLPDPAGSPVPGDDIFLTSDGFTLTVVSIPDAELEPELSGVDPERCPADVLPDGSVSLAGSALPATVCVRTSESLFTEVVVLEADPSAGAVIDFTTWQEP